MNSIQVRLFANDGQFGFCHGSAGFRAAPRNLLIDQRQQFLIVLACQALILEIALVYFVFNVIDHSGNLLLRGVALQVQRPPFAAEKQLFP